jgi:hypothetical protein
MFNIFGDLITNVNIEISDTYDLSSISEMRLVDLYCKHMIRVDYDKNSKANRLLSASRAIGYDYCEWGSHDYSRSNVPHHLGIIEKMEKDGYNHAIRVVVCKYSFSDKVVVWSDNLHSTVKYIREYGKGVRLKDVPFYVIDLFVLSHPIVSAIDMEVLRPNLSEIIGSVSSAYFRYEKSNLKDLIDVGYLVGDLLDDTPELYTYHNTAL